MRQAGRYLPAYRAIRDEHTFLEAVRTPSVAARVSKLPAERFEPDGVIVYADVLGVVRPLGFSYQIESGVGPVVTDPIETADDVPETVGDVRESLAYVGETISRVAETTTTAGLIGYAGGPFTLAAYLLGADSRSKMTVRRFRLEHPTAFRRLLDVLSEAIVTYLRFQTDCGVDLVQLFDTRAAMLSPEAYREWLLPCHRRILAAIDVPTILFVRSPGGHLDALADAGADVLALDWSVNMARARDRLGDHPVQGNLDPAVLFGDADQIRDRTRRIVRQAGPAGHVLNLGHGVHKRTPPDAVEQFVHTATQWSWD